DALLAAGVENLFQGLANNKGLRNLDMTNTGVGVKASETIAACLKTDDIMEVLNLSGNQVRNHGCKQIVDMLGENATVRKLDLSFNMISAIGVNGIVEGVKAREGISRYDVSEMKALELDIVLVGNLFGKDPGSVDESQLIVQPKLARSKLVFDNASKDALDVPMWQREEMREAKSPAA
ncbi:hypothetical protein TeGR_g9188, partial [Tetraparma gracilis]